MKATHRKLGRVFLMALALTIVLAVTFAPAAHAGEYIEGGPDAVLAEGEVVEDDLFIAGEDVLVAGVVEGDLFAAGRDVVISGEVYGNVYAAGQTVTISGYVEGAVMLGGYSIVLAEDAEIGRNLYFGAFSAEVEPESLVGRSVYGGGYQLILNGAVGRDVTAGLGALEISGPVGGDVRAEVGEASGDVEMYTYWSMNMPPVELVEPGYRVNEELIDGAVNITVTPVQTDVETPEITVDPAALVLRGLRQRAGEFLALLLVGALLLWLMKDLVLKVVDEVRGNAAVDTLWGLLVYFLYIPVFFTLFILLGMAVVLISLLTLGSLTGELIALSLLLFFGLTTAFSLLTGLVTKIVVAYLVGRWLLGKLTQLSFEGFWHHFAALASGVFLYEVLRAIPAFGWFVQAAVVLIGTGAIFVLVRNALQKTFPVMPENGTDLPAA